MRNRNIKEKRVLHTLQTVVRSAVCIPFAISLSVVLAGCADGAGLTSYTASDASYTAEWTAADVSFVGQCERAGTVTVMQMTKPERLAGLSVSYDSRTGACSVSASDTVIPLSAEISAEFTELFRLLERPIDDGGVPSKSEDGTKTVLTFDSGEVTVGTSGLPVCVSHDDLIIGISGYQIK